MAIGQIDFFNIHYSDTIAQYASICFDASLSEIFMAVLAGASLYIFGSRYERTGSAFITILNSYRITVLTLPPSLLSSLEPRLLSNLRILISAGEPCPKALGCKWLSSNRRFFNAYGPSEAAVCTTIYELTSTGLIDCETIPIGAPIHGMQIRAVAPQLQDVPKGQAGELLISGIGVSKYGYVNKVDLSIDGPFITFDGKRWYRTGDRVKAVGSNQQWLVYLGRLDNQIKLNGCRIELHEIEAVVLRSLGILYCVTILHRCMRCSIASGTIVVYFDGDIAETTVQKHLTQNLPTYMLPAYIIRRAASTVPITFSGKIDRKVLAMDETIHAYEKPLVPMTRVEQHLLHLWWQVLNHKQKDVELQHFTSQTTFARCGGNSLTAALLQMLIKKMFFADISIHMHMSLEEMSRTIHQTTTQLQEDCYRIISEDLQVNFNTHNRPFDTYPEKPVSSILITGATGFVGCFLLNELLHTTSANMVVMIRTKTTDEANHRLRAVFQKYGLLDETIEHVLDGSCQKRINLCLDTHFSNYNLNDQWCQIDTVLHCAADTDFNSCYENLRDTNVLFTQYLVDACFQHGIRFYYISSLSIFLFPKSNENQSSPPDSNHRNGRTQLAVHRWRLWSV